jgi:hypothetical protein
MPQHPTLPVLALSAATLLHPISRAADDIQQAIGLLRRHL